MSEQSHIAIKPQGGSGHSIRWGGKPLSIIILRGHEVFTKGLIQGERFQVKCIVVPPGQKLHRADHGLVVAGTALVSKGKEGVILREHESISLPSGVVHWLENPGKTPLTLIEVQSGPYLGDDDIVRIEDVYSRA